MIKEYLNCKDNDSILSFHNAMIAFFSWDLTTEKMVVLRTVTYYVVEAFVMINYTIFCEMWSERKFPTGAVIGLVHPVSYFNHQNKLKIKCVVCWSSQNLNMHSTYNVLFYFSCKCHLKTGDDVQTSGTYYSHLLIHPDKYRKGIKTWKKSQLFRRVFELKKAVKCGISKPYLTGYEILYSYLDMF